MEDQTSAAAATTAPFFLVEGAEMVAMSETPPASYELELIKVDGEEEPRAVWIARCPLTVGFRDLSDIVAIHQAHVPPAVVWTVHTSPQPFCFARYVILEANLNALPGGMTKFIEQARLPRGQMDMDYLRGVWMRAIEIGHWTGSPEPTSQTDAVIPWRLGGMVDSFM